MYDSCKQEKNSHDETNLTWTILAVYKICPNLIHDDIKVQQQILPENSREIKNILLDLFFNLFFVHRFVYLLNYNFFSSLAAPTLFPLSLSLHTVPPSPTKSLLLSLSFPAFLLHYCPSSSIIVPLLSSLSLLPYCPSSFLSVPSLPSLSLFIPRCLLSTFFYFLTASALRFHFPTPSSYTSSTSLSKIKTISAYLCHVSGQSQLATFAQISQQAHVTNKHVQNSCCNRIQPGTKMTKYAVLFKTAQPYKTFNTGN